MTHRTNRIKGGEKTPAKDSELTDEEFAFPREAFYHPPALSNLPEAIEGIAVPDPDAPEYETAPRTYYRSDDTMGFLFFEKGAQWFRINACIMDGSAHPEPCSPDKEGWQLEPVANNAATTRVYAPVRAGVIDAFYAALAGLPLQEMEALIPLLLRERNRRTYERESVASDILLSKLAIPRCYTDAWYYQYPDGSPLADEEKERVALEQGEARENPSRGRDLRERDADADGLISCRIQEGFFADVPLWEAHKRGRNWAAKIQGRDRLFLKSPRNSSETGPQYAVAVAVTITITSADCSRNYSLEAGDLIEFAGDYFSERDEKVPTRRFCVIAGMTEKAITFRPLKAVTLAQAEKEAKETLGANA